MPRPMRIDPERLSRAIEEALARRGMDQAALAKAIGVSHAAVSDWVRMKKRPGAANLRRLAEVLGVEDLLEEGKGEREVGAEEWKRGGVEARNGGGDGERRRRGDDREEGGGTGEAWTSNPKIRNPQIQNPADSRLLEDVVLVPRIARGRAADMLRQGGYVNPSGGEVEGYDAYSRSEAQRLSGTSPDELYTVTVVGDSLLPEIPPGTRVAYVPRDRIDDYGLYVILVDDGVLVKRVQRYAGGAIEIIPINTAYSREMLMPLEGADTGTLYRSQQTGLTAEFRVIGKVVFYPKAA